MPTQLQFRRGTTSQNNGFTGAVGELTIDTDTDAIILHDGSAAGGIEIVPSGTIVAFGNTTAPTGWLVCNDQAVSRTTYARLFAVVGTTFGTGDGSSTFNVPDLRDRVPLGFGTNMSSLGAITAAGIAASAVMASATKSGATTATNTTGSTSATLSVGTGTFATSAKDSSQSSAVTSVNATGHTHSIPALTVDDFTVNTTLPSQVVQWIIKT
jgi:microcystin-dependent protein